MRSNGSTASCTGPPASPPCFRTKLPSSASSLRGRRDQRGLGDRTHLLEPGEQVRTPAQPLLQKMSCFIVDSSAFEARYDVLREHAYPPRMLLKLWLFGAIDGTKIRANTSRSNAMSHKRMTEAEAQLDEQIAQILGQIDELNVPEDAEHDDDDGSGGLPAGLQHREQRRKTIRAAREKLAEEKGERFEDCHQKSFADLEANRMKTGEGAMQHCYNAQAMSEDGIIVATALSAPPDDATQLVRPPTRDPPWCWQMRATGAKRICAQCAGVANAAWWPSDARRRVRSGRADATRNGCTGSCVCPGRVRCTPAARRRATALRRDRATHALPALLAPRRGQGTQRVGTRVCSAEYCDELPSASDLAKLLIEGYVRFPSPQAI